MASREPNDIDVDDSPAEQAAFEDETTRQLAEDAKVEPPAEPDPDASRYGGDAVTIAVLSEEETAAAVERWMNGGDLLP